MGSPRRAEAQVETTIHNFASGGSDGYSPIAGLIMDSSGNLYGTTYGGGSGAAGTVFELVYDSASNSYTEQVLYNFQDGNKDGYAPSAGLVMDSSGNLYGTTFGGGSAGIGSGFGTVFELIYNSATKSYTEQVLHNFPSGTSLDGYYPIASLVRDSLGNLYGTTPQGGSSGYGTVFEVVYDSTTNSYTEQVLYSFQDGNKDGYGPSAGLLRDSSGNLYGTTAYGGSSTNCTNGCGTVFELVYSSATNNYAEHVLYNFTNFDGQQPMAGLTRDSSGNLYGTTAYGGSSTNCTNGCGTVFELAYDSATNSYTEQVLHNFTGSDGSAPVADVIRDGAGNLYGTTGSGASTTNCSGGCGTVFELAYDSAKDSYTEQVLHSFTGSDGSQPVAGLIMDARGNLYGTTRVGGSSGIGTVFEIAPVTLSATSLDFGTVAMDTTSPAQTVNVSNIGGGNFSYSTVSLSGANAADFAITSNTCTTAVPPGGTCSVSVTFAPSTASGELASLVLSQGGMTQTVSLTGAGVYPTISLSSTSLTFQAQPVGATSSAQVATLTNTGTVALNVTSVGVSGNFAIDSNTCTTSVDAGQSCTVGVTFSPTAAGTRTGTLTFTDSAASSPQTVALSGTGEDFALTASTTSQSVTAGKAATYDLQLSPEGGFSGDVSLTCSDTASKSTCSLSPASVTLNGTDNSTVTLKVTTTAPSEMVPPVFSPWDLPPMVVFWNGLLVLLGLGVLWRFGPARTRMRPALVASLAAVLLAITFWTACGGGSPAPSITPGTPPGTYTLTVMGTSGSLLHTTTVSLTVQ